MQFGLLGKYKRNTAAIWMQLHRVGSTDFLISGHLIAQVLLSCICAKRLEDLFKKKMLPQSTFLTRRLLTNFVRSHHGGTPGENLPFAITNKYMLTAWFCVFFGSGLAAPFIVLRHQLLKK